ncbi:MAG: PrgI family protein [Clostridium tyrobutyricum]|jgi:Fe2+ transport system protein B|uniref:PrgI family protein n=1 Tax=Clostridium tyrobutyricum TaxID=1519 RepID=UPI00242F65EE|nr:PrgI family protein [Clostridium tyrobutyricum]MCH4200624.1 PrgI family protein [Clostridium tyrobutyricum]MCH4236479.1 PrgI family protein [Clostridium tyrobutyricum]MCH4259501.1 PrgI family protein [Clostridium tyrobutyricum]
MRSFTVPFNIDQEDKIIGGYISLRQFAWLVLAVFIILLLFILNTGYVTRIDMGSAIHIHIFSLICRLIIAIPLSIGCVLLAFIKLNGITADKYIIKMLLFKFRKHVYKN